MRVLALAKSLARAALVVTGCGVAAGMAACGIGVEGEGPVGPAASITVADAGGAPTTPTSTCKPSVDVDDPMESIDISRWRLDADDSNDGFPELVPAASTPFGKAALSLVKPGAGGSRGGMWLRTRVPTLAFDISLSFAIRCGSGGCAEGLVVTWLEALDPNVTDTAATGRDLAIPDEVNGGAVAIDLRKNSETGDGDAPSVALLDVDGTKNPGDYPWTVASLPLPSATTTGVLHKLEIRGRNGSVEARVDGGPPVTGRVRMGFLEAVFGVAAATGGDTATFFVRDVKASFYACDP